jgi:trehalose 6-phosphate phosphatase
VDAFRAVADLARRGLPTLRVCSASDEEGALVELSDVLVHGPDGVLELLRQLTADAADLRA